MNANIEPRRVLGLIAAVALIAGTVTAAPAIAADHHGHGGGHAYHGGYRHGGYHHGGGGWGGGYAYAPGYYDPGYYSAPPVVYGPDPGVGVGINLPGVSVGIGIP